MLMLFFLHAHANQKKISPYCTCHLRFSLCLKYCEPLHCSQFLMNMHSPSTGPERQTGLWGSERSLTRHGISLLALSMAEPQDLNEALYALTLHRKTNFVRVCSLAPNTLFESPTCVQGPERGSELLLKSNKTYPLWEDLHCLRAT